MDKVGESQVRVNSVCDNMPEIQVRVLWPRHESAEQTSLETEKNETERVQCL